MVEQVATEQDQLPGVESEKPKDAPPKKTKRAPRATSRSSVKVTDRQIKESLDSIWMGVGAVMLNVNAYDGAVLIVKGPQVTDALMEVAKVNPRVRSALESFALTSTWGAVFAAVSGVALPILANHGLAPVPVAAMLGPTSEELDAIGIDPWLIFPPEEHAEPADSE